MTASAPDHDGVGPRRNGLGDVAAVLHAAVRDHGHVVPAALRGHVHHRRELGHADARDHAGGADGPGAHPHLHGVHPRLHEVAGGLGGDHVARHHLGVREGRLDLADHVEDHLAVAVGGVHHHHVGPGGQHRLDALDLALADADRRAHAQAAPLVGAAVREVARLDDVLDGQQALKTPLFVHDGQLFNPVLVQEALGLVHRRAGRHGDQPFARGHHVGDGGLKVLLEAQVAVGQDADQDARRVGDGHARHMVAAHERLGVLELVFGRQREGVADDARLRPFHAVHLLRLLREREVLVDHPQAALLRDGDGQPRLRHRVHGRAQQRDVQADRPGQARAHVRVARKHPRTRGAQQHVVERETPCYPGIVGHGASHRRADGAAAGPGGHGVPPGPIL